MDKKIFEVDATIKVKLTTEDIDDIMCAALEGGITYWCCNAEVVGEYLSVYGHEQIARGGSLILHDAESDDEWELTLEKLLNGVEIWLKTGGTYALTCGEINTYDIDSEVADCIVQYALFGELVFS